VKKVDVSEVMVAGHFERNSHLNTFSTYPRISLDTGTERSILDVISNYDKLATERQQMY